MVDNLLQFLFVLNVVLVLADAAVAYHKAPGLIAWIDPDPQSRESGARKVKSLLPLLVALYVTLNCYAYSFRHIGYVGAVTLLLVGDILVQFLITRKRSNCENQP